MSNPVGEYRTVVDDSGNPGYVNRILIGVPVTGLVRIEWVQGRFGQLIPMNWSQVEMFQFLDGYMPLRFQVDEAQNLITKVAIEKEFEWVLLYEHDVIPPPDAFIKLNQYMREAKYPVVSGLYFCRSFPSEPLAFRGRGNGAFCDFKLGEKVWCDGVPTGFLLIHTSVLKAMWEESEPYDLRLSTGMVTTRKVFSTPRDQWHDPEQGDWYNTASGTSDLAWCSRVIEGDYLRKAGWGAFVDSLPDARFPFLLDTGLFCRHINPDGGVFPPPEVVAQYARPPEPPAPAPCAPPALGVSVADGVQAEGKMGR